MNFQLSEDQRAFADMASGLFAVGSKDEIHAPQRSKYLGLITVGCGLRQ